MVALGVAAPPRAPADENQPAELAEALRRLGPPGLLWGRLAAEEESPDGPWTPLVGVEIRAFVAVPSLMARLEQIRQSSRESSGQYATASERLRAALAAYQAQVEAVSRTAEPDVALSRRSVTDPGGLFVFDALPSGEWLLVAVRSTTRPEPHHRPPSRERFLARPAAEAKEMEVWLVRVRVAAGERVSVLLTDRSRWFVGPERVAPQP